jgi:hypothetical protein
MNNGKRGLAGSVALLIVLAVLPILDRLGEQTRQTSSC